LFSVPSHAAALAAVWTACLSRCPPTPVVGVPHGALYGPPRLIFPKVRVLGKRAHLAPLHLHQPLRQVAALRLGARRARLRRILVRAPRLRSPACPLARQAETACCRERGTRAGQTAAMAAQHALHQAAAPAAAGGGAGSRAAASARASSSEAASAVACRSRSTVSPSSFARARASRSFCPSSAASRACAQGEQRPRSYCEWAALMARAGA